MAAGSSRWGRWSRCSSRPTIPTPGVARLGAGRRRRSTSRCARSRECRRQPTTAAAVPSRRAAVRGSLPPATANLVTVGPDQRRAWLHHGRSWRAARMNPPPDGTPDGRGHLQELRMPRPLRRCCARRGRSVHALNRSLLEVRRGETLGIVGESRLRQVDARPLPGAAARARRSGDHPLRRQGRCGLRRRERRAFNRRVQMIFQDPYSSLNPRMTVRQASRSAAGPRLRPKAEIPARIAELLRTGGPAGRCDRALSARVLGRPAAADRHRPGARRRSECWSPTSWSRRSTSPSRPRSSTCCWSCSTACS